MLSLPSLASLPPNVDPLRHIPLSDYFGAKTVFAGRTKKGKKGPVTESESYEIEERMPEDSFIPLQPSSQQATVRADSPDAASSAFSSFASLFTAPVSPTLTLFHSATNVNAATTLYLFLTLTAILLFTLSIVDLCRSSHSCPDAHSL